MEFLRSIFSSELWAGYPFLTVPFLVLWTICLEISLFDRAEMKIPNALVLALVATRLVFFFLFPLSWDTLWGGLLGFAVLFIPAMILLHPMGGDIKSMGAIGLWLGVKGILLFVAFAVISLALWFLWEKRKKEVRKILPLGAMYPVALTAMLICSYLVL